MDCPFPLEFHEENDEIDPDEAHMLQNEEDKKKEPVENFELKKKKQLISKFDTKVDNEEEKKLRDQWLKENTIDDDAPDLEEYDALEQNKQRIHCWVMIRQGLRQFPQTIFIEPTTGRQYTQQDAPYQTIEAIFNNNNFWINLTPQRPVKEVNLS